MDDQNSSYAPRSPDLSAYHSAPAAAPSLSPLPPSHHQHHQAYQPPSYPAGAYQQQAHLSPLPQKSYYAGPSSSNDPASFGVPDSLRAPGQPGLTSPSGGRSTRRGPQEMDEDWTPEQQPGELAPSTGKGRGPGRKPKKQKVEPDYGAKPAPGVEEGIEVKTKFPVARIKRIMQADDDVGKVAQVTPTAVSKALELFMISLVTKAAAQARSKSSKKVTGAHLKQVIQQDEQFDFLADIVANVPDAPAPGKKGKEGVTTGEEDSDGGLAGEAAGKKRKGRARKKVKDEDDDF